jgi:cardiolipin synthase A/B
MSFPELLSQADGINPWSTAMWSSIAFFVSLVIQLAVAFRVIMSRRGVGETLAWIMVVLGVPIGGWVAYMLIGELRLGSARASRFQKLRGAINERLNCLKPFEESIDWGQLDLRFSQLARTGRNTLNFPGLPGNSIELINDWQRVFDRLVDDIDSAKVSCDLQFYIWQCEGRTEEIVAALERARQRGVSCRILVDSLGSWQFLNSPDAKRMTACGVVICEALPSRLWRLPFVRYDLRMHRKLVLIDDQVAWTGSLNLVDPRFFKKTAGVGQWVDAMVRVRGPVVEALAIIFQTDWQTDSEEPHSHNRLPDLTGDQAIETTGPSIIQVLPSGPAFEVDAIEQILLTAIYSARHELIITSPYFVPSESLTLALTSAVHRGVEVTVISPARVDSKLVRFASRAFHERLLSAGVRLAFFDGGLLHTKSVTIDGLTSLFGTLNMDPRSLRLNFEITLAIYDAQFTSDLRKLQLEYLQGSQWLQLDEWRKRGLTTKLLENIARLVSPLL